MEGPKVIPIGRGAGRGRGRGYRCIDIEQERKVAAVALDQLALNPRRDILKTVEDGSKTSDSGYKGSSNLSTPEPAPAKHLTMGTRGTSKQFLTNFVRLVKVADVPVYEYHVSFSPVLEHCRVKNLILKELEAVIGPTHNFDGHILFLPFKLEKEVYTVKCKHPNDASTVDAVIKSIKQKPEIELNQFYDLLFQRVMTSLGYVQFRQGFYEMKEVRDLKKHNLEVWPGVSLSVENNDGGLMVMIDTPRRVLRTDTVYDYYSALASNDSEEMTKRKFMDSVVGKIILCKYNKKCYKVDDVDWRQNPNSEFDYRGRKITFKEYFRIQYGEVIEHLHQPLLLSKVKARKSSNPSFSVNTVKIVALVPELCHFTGISNEVRNNRSIMSEVNALTKFSPVIRSNLIKKLVKTIMDDEKAKSILLEWGIKMEKDPLVVNGRQIKPPTIQFHKNAGAIMPESNFSKESSRTCYDPIEVKNFVVVCTPHDNVRAVEFTSQYKESCSRLGIRVRCAPHIVHAKDGNPSSFVEKLRQSCSKEVQFVIVITPGHDDDLYKAIKVQCTSVSPIPSQCIMARTIQNKNLSKISINVALQINCKLGGSPWALKIPLKKVMFIGMDAAHDPARRNPSVIAFIATLNDLCTRYFSKSQIQPVHQEISTCLYIMFMDALFAYAQENGELPDRIIFYRDGGCASTFEVLKKFEIETCLEVLEKMKERFPEKFAKEVKFSYVCVAKRIPQRLLLFTGKLVSNPQPGSVVDTEITRPYLYDFYIVSQQAQYCTVTPTHYTVLYETSATPPDLMQRLTYALTYMYFNYQGTIKVPAVIQYAHKLGQFCSRTKSTPSREMQKELFFL